MAASIFFNGARCVVAGAQPRFCVDSARDDRQKRKKHMFQFYNILSRMVGVARHVDEDWVTYIKCATYRSEDLAHKYGAAEWVLQQRRRKWNLAAKAAASDDGRWTNRLLAWRPWFRTLPRRGVGRPVKRWDDDLVELAGGDWPAAARDPVIWAAAAAAYTRSAP